MRKVRAKGVETCPRSRSSRVLGQNSDCRVRALHHFHEPPLGAKLPAHALRPPSDRLLCVWSHCGPGWTPTAEASSLPEGRALAWQTVLPLSRFWYFRTRSPTRQPPAWQQATPGWRFPCHQTHTVAVVRQCRTLVLPLAMPALALGQNSLQQTLLGNVLKSSSPSEARACWVVWETNAYPRTRTRRLQLAFFRENKKHFSMYSWCIKIVIQSKGFHVEIRVSDFSRVGREVGRGAIAGNDWNSWVSGKLPPPQAPEVRWGWGGDAGSSRAHWGATAAPTPDCNGFQRMAFPFFHLSYLIWEHLMDKCEPNPGGKGIGRNAISGFPLACQGDLRQHGKDAEEQVSEHGPPFSSKIRTSPKGK